jgi:septum formation protein
MRPELIILASESAYRKALLERLRLPFSVMAANIDEQVLPGETPEQAAVRLAKAKASYVSGQLPSSIVIGSDQVADLDGQAISKPGSHENAVLQLKQMSGKTITFHTALCIIRGRDKHHAEINVQTKLTFRQLKDAEIESYLLSEKPYDCAGSAKCEGLGISLLEKIESIDPTAIIGLPLIFVANILRGFGVKVP